MLTSAISHFHIVEFLRFSIQSSYHKFLTMGSKLIFIGLVLWVTVSSRVQSSDGAEAYQGTALKSHNQYRAKHRSSALTMDENLNAAAVKCAEYYAAKRTIDHSCPYKNGAGENLVGGKGNWTPDQFASMGTKMWYDEVSKYDYDNPKFDTTTGHFTQVVWANSKNFGFGVVNTNGFTAGVGLYDPPGNYQGQFPKNVVKPQ